MYVIFQAMSDLGFSGFFLANPYGAFTVTQERGWVAGDLEDQHSFIREGEVAPSALIQGF